MFLFALHTSAPKSKGDASQSIKKPKMFAANPPNDDTGDAKIGVNERGERFIELGKKRRATVNTFKGACSCYPHVQ